MYKITCDGFPILDFRDEDYIVMNPKLHLETNTVGSASFIAYNNHPNYSKMQKLKSIFEISDEIGVLFRGRMTKATTEFDLGKAVDLEGAMAFFNDSLIAPFNFPEDFETNEDYLNSENVIEFFLAWIIEQHNAQGQDFQKFKLGNVTVTDPNNYLYRSSEDILTAWEVLRQKLFESALGGYLCIRYEADGNYIDYLADFELTNTQNIEYGVNLLDLSNVSDAMDTYSAIVPFGAEIEEESPEEVETVEDEEGEEGTGEDEEIIIPEVPEVVIANKKKLTLEEVADGQLAEDIYKITLSNGLHAVYSKKAVENCGWVLAPVSETTWADVTTLQALKSKAVEYLASSAGRTTDTIEVTAVDLHFSDAEIMSFRIYRYVNIISAPHFVSDRYKLTSLDIDLLNPQNTKIVLGKSIKTLIENNTDRFQNTDQKIDDAINNMFNKVDINMKETIHEEYTTAIKTAEEIVFGALESYTQTGDFEYFKETVESQFKLLSDSLTLKFSQAEESINKVDKDLQKKYNKITTYFAFEIDGLTIGQTSNPYKVIINNKKYTMTVNDVPVMWIENGKVYTPEVEVIKLFKIFDYKITQDDEGIVSCAYVGG